MPDERADWNDFRHASAIYKSLLDFKPQEFGLPAYDQHWNSAFAFGSESVFHAVGAKALTITLGLLFHGFHFRISSLLPFPCTNFE